MSRPVVEPELDIIPLPPRPRPLQTALPSGTAMIRSITLITIQMTAAALLVCAGAAFAADRPRVRAERVTEPIRLDGRLSEAAWQSAAPITGFLLFDVREGEAPSESTDVQVLVSDSHIYFGIRCWNRGAGRIRASLTPRDQILDDDHISVHLDTYRDMHRAYIFGVNPYGVQLDGILDGGDPDFSWDGAWDAEATRDSSGWTTELAIPLRILRFQAGGGVWGLWFRRQITKNDEVCSWPPYRREVTGDIMLQAGDLEGLEGLHGGGRVEIQPYGASTSASARSPMTPGPLSPGDNLTPWNTETRHDAGLDARYGITSTLTGNLTINPDYSQVEADALQIDVNQRYPLYFPEKRPFFLEGAETYSTLFRLVYTRRMADPAYGTKLTGKLGRWRLGAIAVRDDGGGSTEGIGARADATGDVSGSGYFTVGRASYDIGESSNLGLLVTDHAIDRIPGAVSALGPSEPGPRNTVVSADTKLKLARSLFMTGQLAGSWSRTDAEAPGERFSDLLSATGLTWQDGKTFALVYHDHIGTDFRADAGFMSRVDYRETGYEANVVFRPENKWLRYWKPISNGDLIEDQHGVLQERRVAGAIEWGFQKQTWGETRIAHVDERWLSTEYDRWRYIFSVGNSLWRPLSLQFDAALEDGIYYGPTDSTSYLGWQEWYNLAATARPSPRLTSELAVTRSRFALERGGARVYEQWLVGAKTTWQFTRRLYARVYPQYEQLSEWASPRLYLSPASTSEGFDVDALLGYVIHPGSVVYLGINGDFDRVGNRQRATGRTVFVKISYVFQG